VTTRAFYYRGDAISQERINGTLSREYLVDEAGMILRFCDPSCANPTASYLVTWNGHGDALALWRINGDGTFTLANSYTYSTWGAPTTATHNGIADLGFRFLYVGRFDVQWDNFAGLGLYYMHARHYAPAIGRFVQPDPIRAETNLYAYSDDSPVTHIDPEGTTKRDTDFLGGTVGVGASIGGLYRNLWRLGFKISVATSALQHSFDGHFHEWFGRLGRLSQDLPTWFQMIANAVNSGKILVGRLPHYGDTIAFVTNTGGRWFVVHVNPDTLEFITAFIPNARQVYEMYQHGTPPGW
jgi:RHS repeat-associated protein